MPIADRKGTVAARKTASAEDLGERIEYVASLLGGGLLKSEVKDAIRQRYGDDLSARTLETYVSRARELVVKWTGQTKDEHVVEAVAFYRSVLASPTAKMREKLIARERLDLLLDLEPSKKFDLRGKDGGPLQARVAGAVSNYASLFGLVETAGAGEAGVAGRNGTHLPLDSSGADL